MLPIQFCICKTEGQQGTSSPVHLPPTLSSDVSHPSVPDPVGEAHAVEGSGASSCSQPAAIASACFLPLLLSANGRPLVQGSGDDQQVAGTQLSLVSGLHISWATSCDGVGGATLAAAAGPSVMAIQQLGRWLLVTLQRYIRMSVGDLAAQDWHDFPQ